MQMFRSTFRALFMQASKEQHDVRRLCPCYSTLTLFFFPVFCWFKNGRLMGRQAMLRKLLRYVQSNVHPNAVKEVGVALRKLRFPAIVLRGSRPDSQCVLTTPQFG